MKEWDDWMKNIYPLFGGLNQELFGASRIDDYKTSLSQQEKMGIEIGTINARVVYLEDMLEAVIRKLEEREKE